MNKFTPAQQEAIDCNSKNILISAAAGSGKTAVLTERIVRHISTGLVNIDNLLVVTFTESASAEMRERIGKRLHELGKFDQVTRLPLANISTIHSFCRKLVQENFQTVDIDPLFKVGDEAEMELIRSQVMDELFEEEYAREGNEDFLDLADVYGGKTMDGRLDALVRKIYDFIASDPFPTMAAERYATFFESEDFTKWEAVVREELSLGLSGALEGIAQALSICEKPGGPEKYIDTLDDEKILLEKLHRLTDGSFADMYAAFTGLTWGRLSGKKDDSDPELKDRVKTIRDGVKKRVNKLVTGIFFAPPGKMHADLNALAPRVAALMKLAIRFSEAFALEKRARNLLDFTDLEHFAIQILYSGESDTRHTHQFYEVLIDEYQDSNLVQDMILSAVAERRFMVGDVKQSVYRFRRANPGLFLEKYNRYSQTPDEGTRIDLSHNFRSRPEVLAAVNFFFAQLMCQRVGEVAYDDAAALHPGHAEYPKSLQSSQMWVELLDQSDEYDTEESDDIGLEDDETPDNVVAETRVIAKCINELLDPANPRLIWDSSTEDFRPCKQGDIAVIVRSLSAMAGNIIEELKNHGIDAVADMSTGFLDQTEVKTALAFLRVVDNPRQDIELIIVLHSPVYAVDEDELLEIRQTLTEGEDFYDHLLAYAQSESSNLLSEKIGNFLSDLEAWRNAALHLSVSRLLALIYNATGYPAVVAAIPGGAIRQANLRLLLERAMEFEETTLKGLFHFVNYIERLYDSNVNTSGAIAEPTQNPDGRVRLMTIHKSKGLEFPVVICAFLGKKFNTDDTRRPVILHPEFGVGPYYVDTELRTRANTLARYSLARLTARESLSEELRCLYVAMTRAKELLILTGRAKNLEKYIEKCRTETADINLPAYYRSTAQSYLDWIMPCLLRHRSAKNFIDVADSPIKNHPAEFKIRRHHITNVTRPLEALDHALGDTEYSLPAPPHHHVLDAELHHHYLSTPLPSKLSISEIRRLYDITPDSTLVEDLPPIFDPPQFLQTNRKPTPAQIGTAMHTVTEHLDYSTHNTPAAINALIYDLTAKNLLTDEEAGFIDKAKIHALVTSPLAERIRNSPNVYRETPFVLAVPATDFYPDSPAAANETILVHGIIDCYFEEDGQIVLLDYKSDAQPARHRTQMEIYKKAIANATAKNVKEMLIYSFALGRVEKL